eukprot:CAMPEP_0176045912 /NCGR_PEP_ID=MMETSP0120_2-20121206/22795_1 /TAXON_ID=160619 /ORGANISM="Kryptoperidinium foliaceum, Strain CCMP 1326" /LENGTH=871 /DNA_ID=CAMNT_0017379323 /DNA_START=1 /DNA_END=2614 /DNA_ORIENTATION=+
MQQPLPSAAQAPSLTGSTSSVGSARRLSQPATAGGAGMGSPWGPPGHLSAGASAGQASQASPVPSSNRSLSSVALERPGGASFELEYLDASKGEKDTWAQMCKTEIWNLEAAALERINTQVEEATSRLRVEVSRMLREQAEAQRKENHAELADLRREMNAERDQIAQVETMQRLLAEEIACRASDVATLKSRLEATERVAASAAASAADVTTTVAVRADRPLDLAAELAPVRERLERLESALGREIGALAARTEKLEETSASTAVVACGPAAGALSNDSGVARSSDDVAMLKGELDALRREVARLAKESASSEGLSARVQTIVAEVGSLAGQVQALSVAAESPRPQRASEVAAFKGELESVLGEVRRFARDRAQESQQTQALAGRIDTLSAEVAVLAARATASAPVPAPQAAIGSSDIAGDVAQLRSELQHVSQEAAKAHMVASKFEVAEIARRLATLEVASSAAVGAQSHGETVAVKLEMDSLRNDISRLTQEIADERRDRNRALADVSRLSDDVAKAAAATIERAERKFASEIAADRPSISLAGSGRRSTEAPSPVMSGSLFSGSDQVARLLGEMEAELRVDFASRSRLLRTELRSELLGEVSMRIDGVEARSGAMEASLGADLRRLGARVRSLETGAALLTEGAGFGEVAKEMALNALLDGERKRRSLMGIYAGGAASIMEQAPGETTTTSVCSEGSCSQQREGSPVAPPGQRSMQFGDQRGAAGSGVGSAAFTADRRSLSPPMPSDGVAFNPRERSPHDGHVERAPSQPGRGDHDVGLLRGLLLPTEGGLPGGAAGAAQHAVRRPEGGGGQRRRQRGFHRGPPKLEPADAKDGVAFNPRERSPHDGHVERAPSQPGRGDHDVGLLRG